MKKLYRRSISGLMALLICFTTILGGGITAFAASSSGEVAKSYSIGFPRSGDANLDYAQSSQLQGQTGNIGYLRGDFGSSGNQFYTTWFDTRPQWKSDEFKRDLDDVINALRSEEYGLLQSRSQMVRYGRENKESEMQGAYTTEFGFRADTEKYAFVLRCNPTRGDYNFYCLCYKQ